MGDGGYTSKVDRSYKSPNQVRAAIMVRAYEHIRKATDGGKGDLASVILCALPIAERQARTVERIVDVLADAHRAGEFDPILGNIYGKVVGLSDPILVQTWLALPTPIRKRVIERSKNQRRGRGPGAPLAEIRAAIVRIDRAEVDGAWWGAGRPSNIDIASIVVQALGPGAIVVLSDDDTDTTWRKYLATVTRARGRSKR